MGACVVVSPRREGVHGFGASRVAPGFLSRGVNKQHKYIRDESWVGDEFCNLRGFLITNLSKILTKK